MNASESQRCEGVHVWMERELFPTYVAPPIAATAAAGSGGGGRRARAREAIRRGRIVDLQMGEWVAAVRARRPYAPPRGLRLHAFTGKLQHAFRSVWKWLPIRAQVGLSDRRWRLGTRADLVVRSLRTRRQYLIEIKTAGAFGGAWEHDNGQRFFAPLADIPSCPLNHALAQLTITLALAKRDRRHGLALAGAYVVLVDEAHVQRYPLPEWCTKRLYPHVVRVLNRAAILRARRGLVDA